MSTHAERIAELGMEDLRWAYRIKRIHDDATDTIAQMEWNAVIAAHDRAVKAEVLREAAVHLRETARELDPAVPLDLSYINCTYMDARELDRLANEMEAGT